MTSRTVAAPAIRIAGTLRMAVAAEPSVMTTAVPGAALKRAEVESEVGEQTHQIRLWIVDLATKTRRQVVRTLFDESHARFSPDGQWLAYMSNESGRSDVFVRRLDGTGGRTQVSTEGGAWPCWSVDGRTLYFGANGQTAAAFVRQTPTFSVSAPMLIPGRDDLQLASGHAAADRLVVRQGGASPARRELRVVVEWFAELTRRARLPA